MMKWSLMSGIPTLESLRLDCYKFVASLSYIVRVCLKIKTNQTKTTKLNKSKRLKSGKDTMKQLH